MVFFWGKFYFQVKWIFGIFGGSYFRGNFQISKFRGNPVGENIKQQTKFGEFNLAKWKKENSPKMIVLSAFSDE